VWSRWVESSTRLGGFRALKKTTEAPYTTKVNNREHTSRGTTRLYIIGSDALPLAGARVSVCRCGARHYRILSIYNTRG
jgi:hypothetical protein